LDGERAIPIGDFYLLPGDTPQIEHPLAHGELITAIDLPPLAERAIVRALHQALSGVAS
jgi:xanthine dehydrogenase YagS FAD-binding subunit